ncbi:hypothetical protein LIPSTDRAFT_75357 [Lipomyces starkeyi NRRL Y-11557]|uniref:Uncharacterized protein n=1 Tax=Lipomyces starkeyi NRRL Y-11557 TaxID=675824 RepID=A0A1E3PWB3_LIPST|nr:hypothetical protein LIPSTDRAFT_75357 [Lipomyces starkeyi NRRL Y-11557]
MHITHHPPRSFLIWSVASDRLGGQAIYTKLVISFCDFVFRTYMILTTHYNRRLSATIWNLVRTEDITSIIANTLAQIRASTNPIYYNPLSITPFAPERDEVKDPDDSSTVHCATFVIL